MKSKFIFILMFMTATGVEAQSIYDNYISVSWDYNIPLSNSSFVGKGTGLGFQLGMRKKINRFYVGFDANYAGYSDYSARQTTYADNSASTTDVHKYVYSYGFTLNTDYVFRPFKKLMPFVGLGLGVNSNTYKMFYNIYSNTDNSLGVLVRPQAGALLKLGKDSGVAITGVIHYDYSSASSPVLNYSSFSSIGFRLGVAFNIASQK